MLTGLAEGEAKGVEKRIEQGIEKTAKKMLAEGFDVQLIAKVTDLTLEQILNLKRKNY